MLPITFIRKNTLALIIVVVCGSIGVWLLAGTHAATPVVSIESEGGTINSPATNVSDATASGNRAVKFNNGSTGFQANCITLPHVCGYPDATNTGVPTGTTLTNVPSQATSGTGWTWNAGDQAIVVTSDGVTLSNLNIAGGVEVYHKNVTIKNSRITTGGYYPIDYGSTGLLVQDTEIKGTSDAVTACMSFDTYTAIRVNCSGGADGFKANSGVVIQDSYIHDLAVTSSSHNDGIQSTGGSNVTFQHNTCDLRNGGDDCFQPGGSDSGWLYTNNLLAGGNTTCWMLNGNTGTVNSAFTNNRFTRVLSCGAASLPGMGITWTGNYYDDNGAAVNL